MQYVNEFCGTNSLQIHHEMSQEGLLSIQNTKVKENNNHMILVRVIWFDRLYNTLHQFFLRVDI